VGGISVKKDALEWRTRGYSHYMLARMSLDIMRSKTTVLCLNREMAARIRFLMHET
jgi:hypothetical protein